MTRHDSMFGPMSAPVNLACARCRTAPVQVVYRYLGAVALRCPRCGHPWSVQWADYPELRALVPDESNPS